MIGSYFCLYIDTYYSYGRCD